MVRHGLLLVVVVVGAALHAAGAQRPPCPPPETILPCVCSTRNEELQVWCTHSDMPRVVEGLKAIGQYITRPVDELIIEHNYLPALPGRAFRPLKALRLMLRHNNLERVAPGWLAGLEDSLMELFIVEDDLRSLPVDGVAHMKKLQAITIESDQLKRLPSFSRLGSLRYLKVQSSSLIELNGRSFKHLPSLERLQVTGSPRLLRLESNLFHDLPRLTSLNISDCGLNWIHLRAMSLLPSLVDVSFENNRITDAGMVGRACRELPALATLRLDGNRIDRLNEASFVDLPALKELSMPRNRITEIFHGAFHKVPSLKILDLNFNELQRIHPESFLQASGSGLEELSMVGNEVNHVSELRALLDALPRLKFLDMSKNWLEDIPYGALRGHPTLERLHLDGNRIRTIEREAFMAMPALRELRLKNNSLSNHIDGPFWNLPALKGLDLSNNYFRRLEPRLITNLPSLRKVDLSNNNIAIIDPMAFIETPLLENVNISGNAMASIHPATFRHLMGLYELDVSRNRLLEFVPGLPRGIEYLHVSNNQISALPLPPSPDLDLPSLRMLDISANSIRSIPSGVMTTLPQLRKLDVSYNGLQHVEEGSFTGMSRLEMLHLHDNMLLQINPNVFKDMIGLTRLDIHGNLLEIVKSDTLRDTPHLIRLDISRNRLRDVAPNAFENPKSLEFLNISSNYLTMLPETLAGLEKLEMLDISRNQLKTISPVVLSSLSGLKELRMSNNRLIELKDGAFQNLQSLEMLDIRGNDLEIIHSGCIRTLPVVETILLNENHLLEIPDAAFAELPSLRSVELQDNNIKYISNNAFYKIPQLQFLNLSNNQMGNLDSAGLKNLKSLEVLDLSNNKITRVGSVSFENMEWLVELKMDNNKICVVQGSPFNGMPRLKVLSLRNNKMTYLSESAVKSLRSNIAVLDIDGNPLACGCSLAWLRSWLQEASLLGPRCADGGFLKEKKLYRTECESEKLKEEPVLPGCESEIVQDVSSYGTSQVFSPWMEKIKEQPSRSHPSNNNPNPSPEESEYFYDEYVDYPFNETNLVELSNSSTKQINSINSINNGPQKTVNSSTSYHYTPGDTPTLYAAPNPNKTNLISSNKNSLVNSGDGGFTFFGMPIPTLNVGKFWGNNERKASDGRSHDINNILEHTYNATRPNIQGGFVPLTPGASGGFKPIPDPMLNSSFFNDRGIFNDSYWSDMGRKNQNSMSSIRNNPVLDAVEKKIDNGALFGSSMNKQVNHSNYLINSDLDVFGKMRGKNINGQSDVQEVIDDNLHDLKNNDGFPANKMHEEPINERNDYSPREGKTKPKIFVSNVINDTNFIEKNTPQPHSVSVTEKPYNTRYPEVTSSTELNNDTILAVNGPYATPTARKSATITKVDYASNLSDDSQPSAEVRSNSRGPKTSFLDRREGGIETSPYNGSMDWYYQNYNRSGLRPYVGPGVEKFAGSGQDSRNANGGRVVTIAILACLYVEQFIISFS